MAAITGRSFAYTFEGIAQTGELCSIGARGFVYLYAQSNEGWCRNYWLLGKLSAAERPSIHLDDTTRTVIIDLRHVLGFHTTATYNIAKARLVPPRHARATRSQTRQRFREAQAC